MRNVLFISITLFGLAIPVSADQPAMNSNSTTRLGAQRPSQLSPYGKLFEARDLLTQAQQQLAKDMPKKTVVCGMTIIEADRYFDQKMVMPKDDTKYVIRAVPPPVCGAPR